MLQIQHDVDLSELNTLKVSAKAKNFVVIKSTDDLEILLKENDWENYFILGAGANILFIKDVDKTVLKIEISGKKIVQEFPNSVKIEINSGEDWPDFVMWAVGKGLSGVENLALIPGTVGAASVGNVAAYGQNFADVVEKVTGFNLENQKFESFLKDQCQFYYRDSIFKHDLRDKFIITSVLINLSKNPVFDTKYHGRATYESLAGELEKSSTPPYSPKDIAEAVIRIRKVKLPDWRMVGTAGSFFKNPFVSKAKFSELAKMIPDLQPYPVNAMLYPNPDDPIFKKADQVKIPAGRLLDELGWKGKRIGHVGTFEKHALVVVNYGGATGQEILEFTQKMQEDVKKNFEIELEPEVNII